MPNLPTLPTLLSNPSQPWTDRVGTQVARSKDSAVPILVLLLIITGSNALSVGGVWWAGPPALLVVLRLISGISRCYPDAQRMQRHE